jgi:hypothetical protein
MPRRLPLRSSTLLGLLLATVVAPPALAEEAMGQHCLGEARSKLVLTETLVQQTEPLGVENQLQVSGCMPLVRSPGILFDRTNLQTGLIVYAAPVYVSPGAFVSIAPLSILELRAEAEPFWTWPIGMDGAGYFPRSSADEQFEDLPADQAESARGWTATFTGALQAEVHVAPRWTVAVLDQLAYAYWSVGGAPFYYHPRYDLVMARQDWVGKNMAFLLLGRRFSERVTVRAGLTDELMWSARSGNGQNILAGVVTADVAGWPRSGDVLSPFLRVGAFTEHAFRDGVAVLGGVTVAMNAAR